MPDIKRVIDYSNMSYKDVMQLPCDAFRQMLKNSVVDDLNKTEEGRQYLADCERFKQTSPDIQSLRRNVKRGDI